MHLRSWSLVQEVVSGGILNNIVNIGSSHEKNLQASLLCFWMETMVISMCVHILSPPKNWSQRRSFMKIGSTIKGRHHLSDWVVGEDYLWVRILSDIKECISCIWQEMYQNWLFEMNPSETGFFSSASHGALEVNQVCTLESHWTYAYFQVPRRWQWSKEVHQAQEIIQSVLVRRQKSSVGFNWVALEDCSQALAGIGCGCLAAE